MYCPRCGQEQISPQTRFCSRCGFLMAGVADLLAAGGNLPVLSAPGGKGETPRKKGLKQGLFIFLLAFLVVPLAAIFTVAVNIEPFIVAISAILLTVGGLLRAAYALMFESNVPFNQLAPGEPGHTSPTLLTHQANAGALPPQQSIPAQAYAPPRAGNWRDTNDLEPQSVTDNTTKLLDQK